MIFIVGATASGKTDLAVALARALGGEVVSADSRQIYRELRAGTAKPARDGQARVAGIPYHLIDCVGVAEAFDVGRWTRAARTIAADIRRRGRLPIVAGGTGLYFKALGEGLTALPARDEALRRRLAEEARTRGRAWLHQRLSQVDARAASIIPANNIQRVIRALEVRELSGRPISTLWSEGRSNGLDESGLGPAVVLRIDWPAEELRRRICARAEAMWPAMIDEARRLILEFSGAEPGLLSLGYPEAMACARGELGLDIGLQRLMRATCAYAKRQRTWFRHQLDAAAISGAQTEEMLRQALRIYAPIAR